MFTYAALVDKGVFEESNDDRVWVAGELLKEGKLSGRISEEYLLTALCDGVGGLAKGYLAAETTLEFMKHLNRTGVEIDTIKKAVEEVNRRVRLLQEQENLPNGLRTTIAGLYLDSNRLLVWNAGDSRVYRLRYKYLTQLSKDHSLVQDLVDMGQITKEEVKSHPQKNIINKCIGHEEMVNVRVKDYTEDLYKGDLFLLCSDGITDCVDDRVLCDILSKHRNCEDLSLACQEIYEAAIAAGTKDNMSIILLRKDV